PYTTLFRSTFCDDLVIDFVQQTVDLHQIEVGNDPCTGFVGQFEVVLVAYGDSVGQGRFGTHHGRYGRDGVGIVNDKGTDAREHALFFKEGQVPTGETCRDMNLDCLHGNQLVVHLLDGFVNPC